MHKFDPYFFQIEKMKIKGRSWRFIADKLKSNALTEVDESNLRLWYFRKKKALDRRLSEIDAKKAHLEKLVESGILSTPEEKPLKTSNTKKEAIEEPASNSSNKPWKEGLIKMRADLNKAKSNKNNFNLDEDLTSNK